MRIRLTVLTTLMTLSLAACGQKFDFSQAGTDGTTDDSSGGGLLDYLGGTGNSAGDTSKPFGNGVVQMDWGLDSGKLYESGIGASKLTTFYEGFGHTYCFENTKHLHNCQVAKGTVRDVIGSEPVAIQGFQLNFAKQSHNRNGNAYKSYAIEGGWVATAELRFDTASGKMVLGNANVQKIYAGGCDLSDKSGFTAGYFDPTRILTGLYLADEYAVNSAAYTDAHLKAGRVSYSGLVPNPQTNQIYSWKFEAADKASTTDFGVNNFTDTDTSTTAKVSGFFGATSSSPIPRWDSHVIIGFCIKGYKVEQNDYKRPLLHYMVARTHQPKMVFKR